MTSGWTRMMLLSGPRALLLLLTLLLVPAGWTLPGVSGQRGDLVNDPSTDETGKLHGNPEVLADVQPSADELECRDEKFTCTRLYSVHRPIKQCAHQVCFTSLRRTYIINKEICSRLVCKEHEAMKDELCRQRAGLPPRRLRRSRYFRPPPCEDADPHRPRGP
ncbi:Microfibrillar-associated protein 5 [Fukomys damarensis]|uniref:Microfibrillar-associated protein 5 n=1 Tax=Fukomys damarensis TaxID=885580 RepID=A0A091DGX9_FUKDA|nr:Microfibrillar-associated protein 5 [Fukomys damarensis]